MIHLLNVTRTRVPNPERPPVPATVPAQVVTCQTCGRSETCPQVGDDKRAAAARGTARVALTLGCPSQGERHLTTPQPPGVRLEWRWRGQKLPLYVTKKWEVCAMSGPLPLKYSFVVRSLSKDSDQDAYRFALRLKEKGYVNVGLVRADKKKPVEVTSE